MITKDDIKKLADLARIEVGDKEAESMISEIGPILGYIDQIKNISGEETVEAADHRNVLREDKVIHTPGEYTEDLLSSAPHREGNYLKVKKILG